MKLSLIIFKQLIINLSNNFFPFRYTIFKCFHWSMPIINHAMCNFYFTIESLPISRIAVILIYFFFDAEIYSSF